MRNDFTQVETAEIADSELDAVAGGIGVSGAFAVHANADDLTSGISGLTSGVTGLLPNTSVASPVLSTVTGLTGGLLNGVSL
jgi:hypothetical protein